MRYRVLMLLWSAACFAESEFSKEKVEETHQAFARSLHQALQQKLLHFKPSEVPGFVTDQLEAIPLTASEEDISKARIKEQQSHQAGNMLYEIAEKRTRIALKAQDPLLKLPQKAVLEKEAEWIKKGLGAYQKDWDKTSEASEQGLLEGLSTLYLLKEIQEAVRKKDNTHAPIEIGKGTLHSIDRVLIETQKDKSRREDHRETYTFWGMSHKLKEAIHSRKKGGQCQFVGRFDVRGWLGLPLQRRFQYCCFESKFMCVLHQKARPFLNIAWGEPENPNCRGLTLEELQRIPLERLDLSEAFKEVLDQTRGLNQAQLQQKTRDEIAQRLHQLKQKAESTSLKDTQQQKGDHAR